MGSRRIDADVVIVGAGIAGSVLAAILVRAGIGVLVLEQQKKVPERYRGEIMQPYAVEVFRRHGFLDAMLAAGAATVTEFEDLCIHQGQAVVQRRLVWPSEKLGAKAVILRYRFLAEAVREPIRPLLGERLLEGLRVKTVERGPDGRWIVNAVSDDGAEISAAGNLLVGADGPQSIVRRQLPFDAQEPPPPRYCFAGIVMKMAAAKYPYFTSMYPLGAGFFGNAFPVRTEEVRLCMAITHETSRAAHDELEKMILDFARTTLSPLGYDVPAAPELTETLKIEPVFHVRSKSAVLDGACLVGDAAGTVHPITGYGMTLATNDVLHLGQLLVGRAMTGPLAASVLDAFEVRRRRIRERLQELSDLYVRIFLGTAEPDLVEAYWQAFTTGTQSSHPVVARFDEVGAQLGQEFDSVSM